MVQKIHWEYTTYFYDVIFLSYFFYLLIFCLWSIFCLWLTLYLCLCSSCSVQASDHQGTLFLPYSKAQQGFTPLGSDPQTHVAPHIHAFISRISQVFFLFFFSIGVFESLFFSLPPFSLLRITVVYFRLGLWAGWVFSDSLSLSVYSPCQFPWATFLWRL